MILLYHPTIIIIIEEIMKIGKVWLKTETSQSVIVIFEENNPLLYFYSSISGRGTKEKNDRGVSSSERGERILRETHPSSGQHLFGSVNVSSASRATLSFWRLGDGSWFQNGVRSSREFPKNVLLVDRSDRHFQPFIVVKKKLWFPIGVPTPHKNPIRESNSSHISN